MDYPDVNNFDELAATIASIEVLGGFSRSFTVDAQTGEHEADRYVEKLGDYLSTHTLRTLLERAFGQAHVVAGIDGVITASSADELTITYADGSDAVFVRKAPAPPSSQS